MRVKRTRRLGVATKPSPVSRTGVSPVIGPVAGSAALTSASWWRKCTHDC